MSSQPLTIVSDQHNSPATGVDPAQTLGCSFSYVSAFSISLSLTRQYLSVGALVRSELSTFPSLCFARAPPQRALGREGLPVVGPLGYNAPIPRMRGPEPEERHTCRRKGRNAGAVHGAG